MLRKQIALAVILVGALLILAPAIVLANTVPQASSSNYRVNEIFFGSGGNLRACSSTYCSKQAAGETGVGNTSSNGYQANAGFNTDRQPWLQFTVTNPGTNLGTLTSSAAKTATATFTVKTYLSNGYTVVQTSPGPTNSSYIMLGLTTPTISSVGTEQFGINLVANTAPVTFGANPSQAPDASFSFGQAAAGYDTPNYFKYVTGDTIAYSNKSSGETDYTISYLFNVSNATPGGQYTLQHVLVATSTF